MARRVMMVLLLVLAAIACTTDPPQRGGIFGDRPVDPSEEETDANARDGGKDGASDAPADRADTSTSKDVDTESDD